MHKMFLLLKVQLNQSYGFSYFKYLLRNNKTKFFKQVFLVLLIIAAFLPLITAITKMYQSLYDISHPLGQDALVFAAAFILSQSVTLVFGVFYLVSHLYYAKDVSLLITLPIKQSVIFGSKFLGIAIAEYVVTLPFVLPALYIYGVQADPAWYFWLLAFFITLLLPVIPLAIAAIFTICLMTLTTVAKKRDFLRVVGSLLGLLIFLGIQWIQFRFRGSGEFSSQVLISNGLVETVTRKFPPSLWAAEALINLPEQSSIISMVTFIGTTFAALVVLFLLAEKYFFKGLAGNEDVSAKRTKLTIRDKTFRISHPFMALLTREWRLLIRSVPFLMPVLVNIIILPVVLLLPLISRSETSLSQIFSLVNQGIWVKYLIIFAVAGLVSWYSITSSLAGTAVSREGGTFWISKIIPIPILWQVMSKLVFAAAMPIFLLMGVSLLEVILLKLAIGLTALQFLLGLIGVFLAISFSLVMDLINPRLDWTDPQQLMKRNSTVTISVFTSMVFLGLTGWAIYFWGFKGNVSPVKVYIGILSIWSIILGSLLWILLTKAEKFFKKIDV